GRSGRAGGASTRGDARGRSERRQETCDPAPRHASTVATAVRRGPAPTGGTTYSRGFRIDRQPSTTPSLSTASFSSSGSNPYARYRGTPGRVASSDSSRK